MITAAGSAAALDTGLHIIRFDHGAGIAAAVSRRLVLAAHRDGGRSQFVEHPRPTPPAPRSARSSPGPRTASARISP